MSEHPEWMYNEYEFCGVDFADDSEAGTYDQRHEQMRDYEAETQSILEATGLGADSTVIDMGCGTGAFAAHAAPQVKKVYAVDLSEAMKSYCRQKCEQQNITNIEFFEGGFLTYEHQGEPVDGIVSQIALHHLPDFWKQVGLLRCFDMLKPGGVLFLADIVFTFEASRYKSALEEWIEKGHESHGPQMLGHIKNEYSTMDWIMEGLLYNAGFKIECIQIDDFYWAKYVCRKPMDMDSPIGEI